MTSASNMFLGEEIPAEAVVQEEQPQAESSQPDGNLAAEAMHEAEQESVPQEDYQDETHTKRSLPKGTVPTPALLEERRRRQETEAKLKQIEQQLQSLSHQQQMQRQPQMPVYDELEIKEEEVYSDLPGTMKKLEKRLERQLQNERFEMSETMAKLRYDDYEDVIKQYVACATENPALVSAVQQSRAPAIDMYRLTKGHLDSKKSVRPEQIQELVKAEAQKMLQEELAKRGLSQAAQIPPSLVTARGSGMSQRQEEYSGKPSAEELFSHRRKRPR